MSYTLKIINVFLISTVRYFYTPIFALIIKLDLTTSVITMITGGVLSFIVYYNLAKLLFLLGKFLKPVIAKIFPASWNRKYVIWLLRRRKKRKHKKKFTRRNRFIVKFKRHYGMYGIILLTPWLLSLVLGAMLLRKYYSDRKEALPIALAAIVAEGLFLNFIFYWLPTHL